MTKVGGGRKESVEPVKVRGRADWRDWLERNHGRAEGVWLLVAKKGAGEEGVTYEEAVEEALCYGWIDSTVRAHDDDFFKQWYSPRRKGSGWSRSNRERVARLVERGQMATAGLAKVEEARRDGSWDRLEAAEAMVVPDDLAAALEASPAAKAAFGMYAPSAQRQLLWWLATAKRTETRQRRVDEIVRKAEGEARSKASRSKN